jgi:guanylate kinase
MGKIIILSGPSGSGKTTLYKKLMASKELKNKLTKSISVTTRPRREEEKNGRDYLFVSRKMFLYKRRCGHFLESEKIFDNYYGTPNKNIRDLLKAGKNVLLCIDVNGAKTVRRKFPGAATIFINTPSLKVLENRLKKRGSESKHILRLRLEVARKELKEAKHYQYVVINDNLRLSYKHLETIILHELKITQM